MLTDTEKEALTKKHWKQLHSIAWSFVYTTGLSEEDLFAEALFAMVKAFDKYEPEKASFSTFVHTAVTRHLVDYCASIRKEKSAPYDMEIFEDCEHLATEPFAKEDFKELFCNLSDDAKYICSLILDDPINFVDGLTPKKIKGNITKFLRAKGWTWHKIWDATSEIKILVE